MVGNGGQDFELETLGACPLCGSLALRALYGGLQDRLFGSPGLWDYYLCSSCRLAILDPRPTEASIGAAYRRDYYTHGEPGPQGASAARGSGSASGPVLRWLYSLVQRPVVASRRLVDCRYLPEDRPGRLLDIGCGDGAFLARMQRRGWEVAGLEPDLAVAGAVAKRLGVRVHAGALDSHPFDDDSFDAVTMSHVLEHVHDPVRFLTHAWRLLKPGGHLVAIVPNLQSLGHRLLGAAWPGVDRPRHLYIHSLRSLNRCARRAGLRKVRLSTTAVHAEYVLLQGLRVRERMRDRSGTAVPLEQDPPTAAERRVSRPLNLLALAATAVFPWMGEEAVLRARK